MGILGLWFNTPKKVLSCCTHFYCNKYSKYMLVGDKYEGKTWSIRDQEFQNELEF